MNADQKKRAGVLAALVVVLTAAVAWQLWPSAPVPAASAAPPRPAVAGGAKPATTPVDPAGLDVRLGQLQASRHEPGEGGRDPFRFQPKPPPPPPPPPPPTRPGPGAGQDPSAVDPSQPPPPPPPPPITLKFIGVVTREAKTKIAVLSDGRFVFHGREGDIIEGRYRVVRIGEESVQLEYADGRGRQTIRLSGS